MDFLDDGINILTVLHLQFLVMASTLVWGSFLQDFTQPVKNLGCPPGFFGGKIESIFDDEIEIDLIFVGGPAPDSESFLVGFEAHLFDLVVFGFE